MENERQVWIVGDPDGELHATGHRYHVATCYVLDQIHNRDRVKKVSIAALPEEYRPCQICAPGGRTPTSAATVSSQTAGLRGGAQPGSIVELEDLETGALLRVRLVAAGRRPEPGAISTQSPLGSALLGKDAEAVAEFRLPGGGLRRMRIVSVHEQDG